MSADNGVYVLKTKGQYRVIKTQGIDDVFYNVISGGLPNGRMDPVAVVSRFGLSPFTTNRDKAYHIARLQLNEGVCEYGIKEIVYNKYWNQIVKDAKENAQREIDYLKQQNQSHKWDCQISLRNSILNHFKKKNP